MVCVVISQPFLFPWIGYFEQVQLADVFVHYDDVDFSKGSFVNRVQLKAPSGPKWLTIPLANRRLGDKITDLRPDPQANWRNEHIALLSNLYKGSKFCSEMLELVHRVYGGSHCNLADLLIEGVESVLAYFNMPKKPRFMRSSELGIGGRSSERVLSIIQRFNGDVYVTGHGARNYLDHERFEAAKISVQYMDYQRVPYGQLHAPFDPHVSILDLIANCGRDGRQYLRPATIDWRHFLLRERRVG